MPKRRCLDCGELADASRCPTCTRANDRKRRHALGYAERYDTTWRTHAAAMRAQHVAQHGNWCPGWGVAPHESADLVVDHDLGVMCRACNGRKARVHDRPAKR